MTYDRRAAARWDASVLGIHPSDYEEMDAEEREAYLIDALNRAADLLDATAAAFREHLQLGEISELKQAANKISAIARTR